MDGHAPATRPREIEPRASGSAPVRNVGLDIARALAILMVFGSHVTTVTGALPGVAATAMSFVGHAGVELFFSLSGFLIGGILVRLAQTDLTARGVFVFMVRRWFRTLPAYYVVLWGMALWLGMDVGHSALLLQNFHPAEARPLPVSWSLVMEEYFYFFFPLVMLAGSALLRRGAGLVGLTALGLIAACTALRLANAYGGLSVDWGVVHESPFLRMDCAAYGALAAWAVAARPGWIDLRWRRAGGLVLLGCLIVVVGLGALFTTIVSVPVDRLVENGFARWGPVYMAEQYAVLNLVFAVAVVALARTRMRLGRGVGWAIERVSVLSYSIYLTHLGVILAVALYLPGATGLAGVVVQVVATTLATLAVSTLCYTAIERPFLWLRERLAPGTRARV